jgi:carbon storage regulator
MLVLSRKVGEKFWIGENIAITVVRISGGGVRIGIEAPEELPVVREELKLAQKSPAPARVPSSGEAGGADSPTDEIPPHKPR